MNEISSLTDTKSKMAAALKELINKKPFPKITVGDIVEACNINRNTFYYHFENMYDLLYWAYKQEIEVIIQNYKNRSLNITEIFDVILDYIDENINLCQTTYTSLGDSEMQNMFSRELNTLTTLAANFLVESKNTPVSEDYKSFLIYHFSSSLSSEIVWYIKYHEYLDRNRFRQYIFSTNIVSMEAALKDGSEKQL